MDDDGEEKQEGGREGERTAERMERKRDPDADASETREGRGERKYRFTAIKAKGV